MSKLFYRLSLLLLSSLALIQQVEASPYAYMKHGVDISPWKEGKPPAMCLDGDPSSMKGDVFFFVEYDVITSWTPKFTVRGYYNPTGNNSEDYKTGAGASLESFRPPCWDYLDAKTTEAMAKMGHANGTCSKMCDAVKSAYRNGFVIDNERVKCTDEHNCVFNAEDEEGVISVCGDEHGRCMSGSYSDYVEAELAARRGAEPGSSSADDISDNIGSGVNNSGVGTGPKSSGSTSDSGSSTGKGDSSSTGSNEGDSSGSGQISSGSSDEGHNPKDGDEDGLDWALGSPPDIESLIEQLKKTLRDMVKKMNDRIKINYSPSGTCEPLNLPSIPFMGSQISGTSINIHCEILANQGEQVKNVIIDLSKIAGAIFLLRGM